MKFAVRFIGVAAACLIFSLTSVAASSTDTTKAKTAAAAAKKAPAPSEKQLEQLTRALKQKNPTVAYARLSAFAMQKSSGALASRAALALGYYDYSKAHYRCGCAGAAERISRKIS
ncbi:MAG: hypothetical protein ABSB65_17210 [Candidatus Acidiferrales bacterium]